MSVPAMRIRRRSTRSTSTPATWPTSRADASTTNTVAVVRAYRRSGTRTRVDRRAASSCRGRSRARRATGGRSSGSAGATGRRCPLARCVLARRGGHARDLARKRAEQDVDGLGVRRRVVTREADERADEGVDGPAQGHHLVGVRSPHVVHLGLLPGRRGSRVAARPRVPARRRRRSRRAGGRGSRDGPPDRRDPPPGRSRSRCPPGAFRPSAAPSSTRAPRGRTGERRRRLAVRRGRAHDRRALAGGLRPERHEVAEIDTGPGSPTRAVPARR